MSFSEKLFGLRKQAGMTQADLAEKLNVSRQAVSRWEMGTAKPEVDTLIAICDLFDVSLDYLLRNKTEEDRHDPDQPLPQVPHYWDYVPKLWWLPALLTLFFRTVPLIYELALIFGIMRNNSGTVAADGPSLTWLLSPPIAYLLSAIFCMATALCFLWALFHFLKARK